MNEVYENSFLKAKREDDAFMTVGELRAYLEGIPDSAKVSLGALSSNQSVHYLAITTNLFPETLSTTNTKNAFKLLVSILIAFPLEIGI